MSFTINFSRTAQKNLKKIPSKEKEKILDCIRTNLIDEPLKKSKPLKNPNLPDRRIRQGDYRISFNVDAHQKTINIMTIFHRKDCYE